MNNSMNEIGSPGRPDKSCINTKDAGYNHHEGDGDNDLTSYGRAAILGIRGSLCVDEPQAENNDLGQCDTK